MIKIRLISGLDHQLQINNIAHSHLTTQSYMYIGLKKLYIYAKILKVQNSFPENLLKNILPHILPEQAKYMLFITQFYTTYFFLFLVKTGVSCKKYT